MSLTKQKPPKLTIRLISQQIHQFGVFCYSPRMWSERNDKVYHKAERIFVHPDTVMNQEWLLMECGGKVEKEREREGGN